MSMVWYKVLPAHFGGQKGIANFNEALGKHLPLTCVCSKNNEPGSQHSYQVFNWLPISKLQIINPIVILRLLLFAGKHKITHVILEHPYHFIAATLLKWSGKTIICHSHNIEFKRCKTTGKKYSNVVEWMERYVYKLSDLLLLKTNEDVRFVEEHWNVSAEKLLLMPYCIDQPKHVEKVTARSIINQRHNIPAENILLLFNGTLDYAPNAEAVVNIKKHLVHALRKLQVPFTILITGRLINRTYAYIETLRAREVIMAGYVDDIDTYFTAADVYINAVAEGEGIQTKTLEALSYHLPVVMFEHMGNGIERNLAPNHIFFLKPHDWKMFAAGVLQLHTSTRQPVPNVFFQHYSFDRHLPQLVQFINKT
jgi:polysaccharide biosynthesis protein PslH